MRPVRLQPVPETDLCAELQGCGKQKTEITKVSAHQADQGINGPARMKTILSPINEQNGPGPPSPPVATDPTRIDKSLEVNGEVIGSESLYIDGKVKGTINLPGSRVTIGRNGQVSADICAREVVVLGEVQGNIDASERVNITSEGSLIGDVIAQRVSIAEGAFFRGVVDIHTPGPGSDHTVAPGISSAKRLGAAVAVQA
jgi:cytoskeletal protein CcmA (bactofilin family)